MFSKLIKRVGGAAGEAAANYLLKLITMSFLPKPSVFLEVKFRWLGSLRVVLNKIHAADSFRIRHIERAKKRREQTSWIFLSRCRRDFLLLTKGKAPLTVLLGAVAAARLGGAPSAVFLWPLPATNGANQPISGKLFPCQAGACRAPGSGFPRTLFASARGRGKLGLRKEQLSGFRSNFHPHPGGNQGSTEGAPGRGTNPPGSGDRCGGRGRAREGGGPRALTSSAIFQTFDPFRKARCSPAAAARPRWPGRQRARGRAPGRRTTCRAPGSCSRRRRRSP